jgi:hypothetical protein
MHLTVAYLSRLTAEFSSRSAHDRINAYQLNMANLQLSNA